jgi:hypothetical protein
MSHPHATPFTAGKYLITPLARNAQSGTYTASLSVRRGKGTQTHDRIYTFLPEFASRDHALTYAAVQGRNWLSNPAVFA